MADQSLRSAVERFAQAAIGLSDSDLDHDFTWRYHDEGVRFALLGTYHELRDLALITAAERVAQGTAPTLAQRALAQYHAAYCDLQATLLGVTDSEGAQEPSAGEWPISTTLLHMIKSERAFFGLICYAVERLQLRPESPLAEPDEDWSTAFCSDDAEAFAALDNAPLSQVRAFYDDLHERIVSRLSDLSDTDLGAPSWWWEEAEVPVIFRIQRMDAHMRQHSIQVEKTLDALGLAPSEAKRLLRLIYAALAEAEGAAFGAESASAERQESVASAINDRTNSIGQLLA